MTRLEAALARVSVDGALSWPTFWVTYAVNLVATFSSVFGATANWWQRLVAVSLAQIAMFAVLAVASRVEAAMLRPAARGLTALGWFALAGAFRGLVVAGVFAAWGVASGEGEWPRVITGVTLALAVLTPMSVVVGNARRYSRARAELLAAQEVLQSAAERIAADIDDLDSSVLERVRSRLMEAFEALAPDVDPGRLARVADEVVRPLSHELANSAPERDARLPTSRPSSVGWRDIVDAATSGRPFLPLATAALVVLLGSVSMAREIDPTSVVIAASLGALLGIYLPLVGVNAILVRALDGRRASVRVVAVVLSALCTGIAAGIIANALLEVFNLQMRTATPAVLFWALALVVPLLALPLAMARGAAERESASLAQLRSIDDRLQRRVARLAMVQWTHQRSLARALHGPVQSTIAASARRLGEIPEAQRAAEIAGLQRDLLELLQSGLSGTGAQAGVTWEERKARIVATWAGLVEVDVDEAVEVGPALRTDIFGTEIAAEILTEAVSNAARHGRATQVRITACLRGSDDLVIEATDDGTASTSPRGGLGTRLLDDCSLGWSRESSGTGTHLRVVLPLGKH